MTASSLPAVIVIDPVMVNRVGHHHYLMSELRAGLLARGARFQLYVPREADPESVVNPFNAVPCLDHLPKAQIFPMPVADIGAVNYRFYLDIKQISAAATAADTVFFPIANHRNLFGILRWLEESPPDRRPHCALLLSAQECFDGYEGATHARNSQIYAHVLRQLTLLEGRSPLLLAYSTAYAAHLENLADNAVTVRLFPFSFLRPGTMSRTSDDRPPLIGLFGNTGWEQKGLEPFLDAARYLLDNGRPIRFLIQIDETFAKGDLAARLAPFQDVLNNPSVTPLRGDLSKDAYDRHLAECALVALPYGPAYRYQPSGILFEALARNVPVVIPANSEMERDTRALGIEQPCFEQWNGPSLANAIDQALCWRDFYTLEARRAAVKLRGQPSATERLIELLLEKQT